MHAMRVEAQPSEALFVQGSPVHEAYVAPLTCDQLRQNGQVSFWMSYFGSPSDLSETYYVGLTRGALTSLSYWRDLSCVNRTPLTVRTEMTIEGETVGVFTVKTSNGGSSLSGAALNAGQMPASGGTPPPGHETYTEALAQWLTDYTWTEDRLALLDQASTAGHPDATLKLTEETGLGEAMGRVFYNIQQGNGPLDGGVAQVVAQNEALLARAIDMRIGAITQRVAALKALGFDIAPGSLSRPDDAPPFGDEIETALNRALQNVNQPISRAMMGAMNLPPEAGWICDGTWCEVMGGAAMVRFDVPGAPNCGPVRNNSTTCRFGFDYVVRGPAALEGSAQNRLFSGLMRLANDQREGQADLVRRNGQWQLAAPMTVLR
ncbi:MAG: hypothetical protein AAF679_10060 [Pseudomonadota bacterium]